MQPLNSHKYVIFLCIIHVLLLIMLDDMQYDRETLKPIRRRSQQAPEWKITVPEKAGHLQRNSCERT